MLIPIMKVYSRKPTETHFNLSSFLMIFTVGFVHIWCVSAQSQSSTESAINSEGSHNLSGKNDTIVKKYPQLSLDLCSKNNNISVEYCSCDGSVISCDFSQFPVQEKVIISPRIGPYATSLKRLCLCNSPYNVLLNLSSELIPNSNIKIHRIDIQEIKGLLHLNGAFTLNFSGDFYMSDVYSLSNIHSREFGRGYDLNIEDVEDLNCCSTIKSSPSYTKPTLYLKNVTIGRIKSQGIDSMHLWRTVILKSVQVSEVDSFGINFNSNGRINVSISNCDFKNVSDDGIRIHSFENLLVAKNSIKHDTTTLPLDFGSTVVNSTLLVVDNYFISWIILRMDAFRVLNWFNDYSSWYEDTFYYLNVTSLRDRIVSIEYNTIGEYFINDTVSFPPLHSGDTVIFNENLLGYCNCSEMSSIVLPDILSNSRCENIMKNDAKGYCRIDFRAINKTCLKEPKKADFTEMCKDASVAASSYHGHSINDVKTKATGLNINSPFIVEMLKDTKNVFHVHHVLSRIDNDEDNYQDDSSENDSSGSSSSSKSVHSGHTTLYIFLSLLGVCIVIVAITVILRRRRRSILGGQINSESYDVLTTST